MDWHPRDRAFGRAALIAVTLAVATCARGLAQTSSSSKVTLADLPRAARTLASAQGDTLLFESDSLTRYSFMVNGVIDTPLVDNEILLTDSTTIILDDTTPAGTYQLASGGSLVLWQSEGYPRYYGAIRRPNHALFFAIRSNARVAALVDSGAGASLTLDQARAELLARLGRPTMWPSTVRTGGVGFEFPRDWYRRANIEFEPAIAGPLRVTWVAYGQASAPSPASRPPSAPGQKTDWLPMAQLPPPQPRPPSAEMLRSSCRIIGELVVHPKARAVEERETR
jgi:hypothetical protein